MRKREKRTDTRCGLGDLSNLEIDVRVHDVRSSGNRQIYGDEKFGVGVDGMAQTQRRRWWLRVRWDVAALVQLQGIVGQSDTLQLCSVSHFLFFDRLGSSSARDE